ncbi:hypothetical protein GCM10009654_60440 [Streptomyces hebeiensis]|uniref:Uncharacterized protein n=1 Tax=Streptomyces hebeiensis TaxID=229486 RepID=A0ABP4FQB0_9ACTN
MLRLLSLSWPYGPPVAESRGTGRPPDTLGPGAGPSGQVSLRERGSRRTAVFTGWDGVGRAGQDLDRTGPGSVRSGTDPTEAGSVRITGRDRIGPRPDRTGAVPVRSGTPMSS